MPTLVCIPIMVHDAAEALADADQARLAGADLVEYRIDECFAGEGDEAGEALVRCIVRESPLPCIVTCRAAAEGGGYTGGEDARVSLYEGLCVGQDGAHGVPRYIDIEASAYFRSANIRQKVNLAVRHPEQLRDLSTDLILSMHDFAGRPVDLARRVSKMTDEHAAAVLKVAYRARSLRDSLELLDLPALTARPTIALGMGEFGLVSRILAPKFGGFLTFAALRSGASTAPGQPTIAELFGQYRFRSIGAKTAVYGVAGWPVGHSMSPLVHNAGFEAEGVDAVYLPLPIAADADAEASYLSFKATMLELVHHPRLTFHGCSVTLPHKEHLVRLAREAGWRVPQAVLAVGAANTLLLTRDGGDELKDASIIDTDGPALRDCIAAVAGVLAGKRIALIGAGGVARSAAAALVGAGCHVMIFNRDARRADQLVEAVSGAPQADSALRSLWGRVVAEPWSSLDRCACDAVVNCTPVGMKGGPDPRGVIAPLEPMRAASPGLIVMDTVYNPVETPLLKAARAMGLRTIDGASMFVAQAAAQFAAWTGKTPAAGLFDRLVRERLGHAGQ